MTVIKRIIPSTVVIALVLSSSVLSTGKNKTNNKLQPYYCSPYDTLNLIFQMLDLDDLFCASLTCSYWSKIANIDGVFSAMTEEKLQLPEKFLLLNRPKSNKDILYYNHQLELFSKEILSMPAWPRKKLKNLCSNFFAVKQSLINNLEILLLQKAVHLGIKTSAQFASFIIAHYEINMRVVPRAAYKWMGSSCLFNYKSWYGPWDLNHEFDDYRAIWETAEGAASSEVKCAASRSIEEAVTEAYNAMRPKLISHPHIIKDAYESVIVVFDNFVHSNYFFRKWVKLEENTLKLATIFTLAYIAQPDFINHHVPKAYEAALSVLRKRRAFGMPINRIRDLIKANTRPRFDENNPHRESLITIMNCIDPENG